jgi:hypothetical protein
MNENDNQLLKTSELEVNGVYFTAKHDLVQVKSINEAENKLHILNLSENCNIYLALNRHTIVKRVR